MQSKRTKSLKLEDMLPLFNIPNTRWISLQYGEVNSEIKNFNASHNLNLIVPEDVDLAKHGSLVCISPCCDRVVSAANTTIHGAGCLGIPPL